MVWNASIVHDRRWWFGRRPQGPYDIDWLNPLSNAVTHVYVPGWDLNIVNGSLVQTKGAMTDVMTPIGPAVQNSGTGNTGRGFTQDVNLVNAKNPWTIAAIWVLTSSVSGVSDNTISTTAVGAADWSGSKDRGMGWTFSSPNLFLRGATFDTGTKTVQGSTGVAFSSAVSIVTAVVSASSTQLRCFLNGKSDATATTITAAGFGSYSSTWLSWGTSQTESGYQIPLIVRTDGIAWAENQAQEFHNNPWQVLKPRASRRIVLGPPAAGGDILFGQAIF